MVSIERVGPHEVHWDETPARRLLGHGVEFRLADDGEPLGRLVAFIVEYAWLHAPGRRPVVVWLFEHGEDRAGRGPGEAFADDWPQLRAEAQAAVRLFLAMPRLPLNGTRLGRIVVGYNA